MPGTFIDSVGVGPDVYLIAGAGCGPAIWDGVAQRLREVCLHRVGLAGFAGVPAIAEPLLEAAAAELADHVARRSSGPVALVAHSLGCFLAYRLGAALPERVRAIVAIDGPPALGEFAMPELDVPARRQAARERAASFQGGQFQARLCESLAAMVSSEHLAWLSEHAAQSSPAAVGEALFSAWTTDLRPLLPRIDARMLAVLPLAGLPRAMRDGWRRRYREQLAGVRRLDIVELEHAHHFAMLDAPATIAACIREALRSLQRSVDDSPLFPLLPGTSG